jgi:hypothetical protein
MMAFSSSVKQYQDASRTCKAARSSTPTPFRVYLVLACSSILITLMAVSRELRRRGSVREVPSYRVEKGED